MILVWIAFLLACVGLAWQIRDKVKAEREAREKRIAECAARGHNFQYRSLDDRGYSWQAVCRQCPTRLDVKIEDVPDYELDRLRKRREERQAKQRRAGLL